MPNVQPISDDQELAKVLAGVTDDIPADQAADTDTAQAPQLPETPEGEQPAEQFAQPEAESPTPDSAYAPPQAATPGVAGSNLESIKTAALQELRPLVDKLNVTPQEKFDVLLLLLRSTDDATLVETAHAAAKDIVDETARAQALLDVIKEIDFLSNPQAAQTT